MSISLNQIDELRERTGVSYTDAKEALENCGGDMLEAIVYLERNKKARPSRTACPGTSFSDKISALLNKGSSTRCIMYKQNRVILNISVNIVVLIGIITIPLIGLTAAGLLIALLTGHRFKLESSSSDTTKINETLDKVCNSVDQAKEKLSESITANTKNTAE
ncbi:MAG: hypothetical protein APF77_20405 [Clostridia bacterium BRH_c25]|nr:MAG: hypothetical protein APF77_20405 [Clostridia bacterium BRH_c25]